MQADTIVPESMSPMAMDRYAYAYNDPQKRIDPSGHDPVFPMIDGLWGSAGTGTNPALFDEKERAIEAVIAKSVWETFEGPCRFNCAYFSSSVIYHWGVPKGKSYPYWDEACDCENWSNAACLFNYLTEVLGFEAFELPYTSDENIILPDATLIFYNDGSFSPDKFENAALFEEAYRFNHVAVVVGQAVGPLSHIVSTVLDVDNAVAHGEHRYNDTSTFGQSIWAVIIDVNKYLDCIQ